MSDSLSLSPPPLFHLYRLSAEEKKIGFKPPMASAFLFFLLGLVLRLEYAFNYNYKQGKINFEHYNSLDVHRKCLMGKQCLW